MKCDDCDVINIMSESRRDGNLHVTVIFFILTLKSKQLQFELGTNKLFDLPCILKIFKGLLWLDFAKAFCALSIP